MASLILLVVVAAWLAVLIPPLLRSRLENRPNSSVTDFRNQLSSLQRAMPSSRTVSMRAMGRPLAPSPLSRPAASGRPTLRSGVRTHGGNVRSAGQQAAMRSTRPDVARLHDASLRSRPRGEPVRQRAHQPATRSVRDQRDAVRRRRANVLLVLALVAGCSVFLAATTKAQPLAYLAAGSCFAIAAYLLVLGQAARPVVPERRGAPRARRAGGRARRGEAHDWVERPAAAGAHRDAGRSRGYEADRDHHGPHASTDVPRRRPVQARRTVDRWSPAV